MSPLARGATLRFSALGNRGLSFNPHPSCGERLDVYDVLQSDRVFQSANLAQGATSIALSL